MEFWRKWGRAGPEGEVLEGGITTYVAGYSGVGEVRDEDLRGRLGYAAVSWLGLCDKGWALNYISYVLVFARSEFIFPRIVWDIHVYSTLPAVGRVAHFD